MKNLYFASLYIILILSCKAQNRSLIKEAYKSNIGMKKFDLFTLKFNEHINGILSSNDLQLENDSIKNLTLLGHNTYKSSNKKLLVFNGFVLNGVDSNNIILHYSEIDSVIKFYELELFQEKDVDTVLNTLKYNFGPYTFYKNTSTVNGSVYMNNKGEPTAEDLTEKFYVWEDAKTQRTFFIIYHYNLKTKETYFQLTAMDKKDPSYKDWMNFRSFDSFYKN